MKLKHIHKIMTESFILSIVFSVSMIAAENSGQIQYKTQAPDVNNNSNASAAKAPTRRQNDLKIDVQAIWQASLREYGINDFRSDSLINLLSNETSTIRLLSAMLLGEKKERSAIPKLEESLNDKSFFVMLAAAEALLKMENRKGLKKLEEYCDKVFKQIENDHRDYGLRNPNNALLIEQSLSLKLLADAGEVSAIPYLRKLLENKQLRSTRITVLRSLIKLYEKDKTVLKDITSMLEDDNPRVKEEASRFLQKIEKEK